MIQTEQTVVIRAGIDQAWDFARDIRGWASLVPGMQNCEVIDDDNSRWTVKVGVGGLVRTVTAEVHVERWEGPGAVDFTYKLKGDPVTGGGAYRAAPAPEGTAVTLALRVEGAGPMAPMWEAMGRPLLPQLAKAFAVQLKAAIEQASGISAAPARPAKRSVWALIAAWLRRALGKGEPTT
ncbi:MAG: SRPBCC family protein [Novosphingobium sp.]